MIELTFFVLAVLFLRHLGQARWILNPAALFVVGQVLMFAGSLPLLDMTDAADQVHLWLMLVTLIAFIVGAIAADRPDSRQRALEWVRRPTEVEKGSTFTLLAVLLITLSLTVTLTYYGSVGVNIFTKSIVSFYSSGQGMEDAAKVREDFYAGSRYFAPGYANQFKNTILPLFAVYYWLKYRLTRRNWDRLIALCLLPVAAVALLGTAQRGAWADFVVMSIIYAWAALPRKMATRYGYRAALFGIAVFALATFFLGRGSLSTGEVRGDSIGGIAQEVWERAIWGNQFASVAGFRYIYSQPVVWGQDWKDALLSIAPGQYFPHKPYAYLAVDIFETLYRSRVGTAPPSTWGNLWYNWGPIGTVVVAFLMGMIYEKAHQRIINGPKRLARLGVWSGITLVLGLWLIGGVETLLNRGLVTLIILGFLIRRATAFKPRMQSMTAFLPTWTRGMKRRRIRPPIGSGPPGG